MQIWLLRHGETAYNQERRYQGRLDIPLSEEGKEKLRRAGSVRELVYVTPLQRTAQTAEAIFPGAAQRVVPGLTEMDFGAFEGHTHRELKGDPAYEAFLSSGGWADCPDGERREAFSKRVCGAFAALVTECAARGEERLITVTHGGTIMALLERYGTPQGQYYEWLPGNGEGYELALEDAPAEGGAEALRLRLIRRLSYQKDAGRIHLYYGMGRGKSSTAAGTALRALHAGYAVDYLQLCKGAGSGETALLEQLGARVIYGKTEGGFVSRMEEAERAALRERQTRLLAECLDTYRKDRSGQKRLLVLDEVCAALRYEVLEEAALWDALLRKPSGLEIILTGREPAPWLIEAADYVTEYTERRHPYAEGIAARAGIEY